MILTDGTHLISDTNLDELHIFAQSIGLRREWFQDKRLPHYDLTTSRMKQKALHNGANLCDSKKIVKVLKNMAMLTIGFESH